MATCGCSYGTTSSVYFTADANWLYWTGSDSTSTAINNSNANWRIWTSGTTNVNVSPVVYQNNDANWLYWSYGTVSVGSKLKPAQKPTPEQAAEIQRQNLEWRERQRLADEKRQKADATAMELLEEFLDAMQRDQLKRDKKFTVITENGHRFVIEPGIHKGATEYDENGKELGYHCIYTPGVPGGDEALAKKLMLETNEAEFRRISNFTPARV